METEDYTMKNLNIKNILLTLLLLTVQATANFNFGECSGSGTFEQQIVHYADDYENTTIVGTIPQGIEGLRIELTSDKDVDIRLYGENEDKIVHWPYGIHNQPMEKTKPYQDVNVTYSGYNGTDNNKGHEFITVEGTTPTAMTMKAFGYHSGYATANYSWSGKENCTQDANGTGNFIQILEQNSTSLVGTIPPNINNVEIQLTSDKDLDIQLYGADGTAIVAWKPTGLIAGPVQQSIMYHDMNITWSGYNGTNGQTGHEYIKIAGLTTEVLVMKVFGYEAGSADVTYSWGNGTNPVICENNHTWELDFYTDPTTQNWDYIRNEEVTFDTSKLSNGVWKASNWDLLDTTPDFAFNQPTSMKVKMKNTSIGGKGAVAWINVESTNEGTTALYLSLMLEENGTQTLKLMNSDVELAGFTGLYDGMVEIFLSVETETDTVKIWIENVYKGSFHYTRKTWETPNAFATILAWGSTAEFEYIKIQSCANGVKTPKVTEIQDTIKPIITLIGENSITINQNEMYSDAGASANDNKDGDISQKIIITSTVDTSTIGTYTVKYNVSDEADNHADEVIRTIKVIEENTYLKPWDHGSLEVTSDGHMIQHQDGTGFFWMADTIWAMPSLPIDEIKIYLDNRAEKRFSVIQMCLTPGHGGPQSTQYSYKEAFLNNDYSTPNNEFWEHIDSIVEEAEERSLYLAILPTWNSRITSVDDATSYGEFVANRYKDSPNVIWVNGADESNLEGNEKEVWTALGNALHVTDPNHLVAFHSNMNVLPSVAFENPEWLDINMDETGHSADSLDKKLRNYIRDNINTRIPSLDGESSYKDIKSYIWAPGTPEHGWNGPVVQDDMIRKSAYMQLFYGAVGHTYGHHAIWQLYAGGSYAINAPTKTWQEALDDSSAYQIKHITDLMQSRPILPREPKSELVINPINDADAATLGNGYAFVYVPKETSMVTIDMNKVPYENIKGWWYNPRNGQASVIGEFTNSGTHTFTTLTSGEDWVLVLDDSIKNFSEPGFSLDDVGRPVLTLQGELTVTTMQGELYTDAGATALDSEDGNITVDITVHNPVDTSQYGTYTIVYNVTDSDGNKAYAVSRTVIVKSNLEGEELILGGGNDNGALNKALWSYFGETYEQQTRTYNEELFIYATPKDSGSGMYQEFVTEVGREYEVNAILIGTDTNRLEEFNGESYLTIGSIFPVQNKASVFAESNHITGGVETKVSFRFTAVSSSTYLALRSDAPWHYASARAISVKAVSTDPIIDLTKPVIMIKGESSITISKDEVYIDEGASASDNKDGDISANIIVTSNVNTSVVGDYTVRYNVSDKAGNQANELLRIVQVKDVPDTIRPVIRMIGDATVVLMTGDSYTDAGANAIDNKDGDISQHISVTSTVNTSVAGSYVVKYNVTDIAGNQAYEVTRDIRVIYSGDNKPDNFDKEKPIIELNGEYTVVLTIDDSYSDEGAIANDNKDGDITQNIVTLSMVDTSKVGIYTVKYNVNDEAGNVAYEMIRDVIVKGTGDNMAPILTLNGAQIINVKTDSTYSDAGATASDNRDGDISSDIEVINDVDTATIGTYTVTYNVSDAHGNKANELVRTVKVSDDMYTSLELIHLSETLVITDDDTLLENKHFICDTPNFSGIKVSARNTLIKGSLFENCATAIELSRAYDTTITGNRFENVGAGIIGTYIEEGSRIEYNEFSQIGILDCTVATGGWNCNIYGPRSRSKNGIFSHNLVDNRGANSRYMEDYIAIYSGSSEFVQNMVVEDNLLVGSLVSSSSGSCFLADGRGSKYIFRGNQCYNVSGYGMAIASAKNALVEDNLIYMDEEHVKAITRFNTDEILDGSYVYAVTDYYTGECSSDVTFLNNKGYHYVAHMGNIRYGWKCLSDPAGQAVDWDMFSLEGDYANNITLNGNEIVREDPHWTIPENIFDGLDSRYFSGNEH